MALSVFWIFWVSMIYFMVIDADRFDRIFNLSWMLVVGGVMAWATYLFFSGQT